MKSMAANAATPAPRWMPFHIGELRWKYRASLSRCVATSHAQPKKGGSISSIFHQLINEAETACCARNIMCSVMVMESRQFRSQLSVARSSVAYHVSGCMGQHRQWTTVNRQL